MHSVSFLLPVAMLMTACSRPFRSGEKNFVIEKPCDRGRALGGLNLHECYLLPNINVYSFHSELAWSRPALLTGLARHKKGSRYMSAVKQTRLAVQAVGSFLYHLE